jgi:formylglycine-generating enzyme required for sulfatase activity
VVARRRSVRPQLETTPPPKADEAARRSLTELVLVPGGELRFGAADGDSAALSNEGPPVTVRVAPFYLEAHEVTNRQYKIFLDATGYPSLPRSDDPRFSDYDWDPETRTFPEGMADHPVVNITRDDAVAYAQWAGRRLPTEIEWEHAARYNAAGALYPWGNSLANRLFANYDGAKLLPVASYPPNELGLYDLAGNAFEWMSHDYRAELHEAIAGGAEPQDVLTIGEQPYGLLRGGAFYSTAREARSSYREYNDPAVRYPGYSLRLAADAPN